MISKKEVQHIAKLARLGINKEEEKIFRKDFFSILNYFNILKEVDTSGVEPMFNPTDYFLRGKFKEMREDKIQPQTEAETDRLRSAFPEKEKGYLKVKSILPFAS